MNFLILIFTLVFSANIFAQKVKWIRPDNNILKAEKLKYACKHFFIYSQEGSFEKTNFSEYELANLCFGTVLHKYQKDGLKAWYIEVYF